MVAGDGVVCAVGDAFFEHGEVEDADEGVAVLDVVVEEGEGEAGGVCFDPEGDFAEVDGERVLVDGVDALLDDVAQGLAALALVGFGAGGADAGEFGGDPAGGGEQEVAGAGGGIADAEVEQRPLLFRGRWGGVEPLAHDGDERGIDQFADEFGRGVVGAGLLALAAGGEVEAAAVGGDAGCVVEQGFVDGAELFDVEVGVVDAAQAAVFGAVVGEAADGFEQLVVGAFGPFDAAAGGLAEEFAVEGGEADFGGGVLVAADAEGLAQADPEVGVVVGLALAVGALAQPADSVVPGEDFVLVRLAAAGEELALLGHHEEEQAVDEVEQFAVEAGSVEGVAFERFAERVVALAREQGPAERFERPLDAVAQLVADAPALFDALLVEAFERAIVGGRFGPGEAGAVEQAVEEGEVGVGVLLDHGLEVELQPGAAGAPGGIAEDADLRPVGEDAPDGLGAVEQVLEQRVGAAAGALGASVEVRVGADDVDGRGVFGVVGAAVDVEGGAAGLDVGALEVERAEAEPFEQRLDERLAGHGVGVRAALPGVPEGADVGERGLRLVGEPGGGGQLEVPRALAGRVVLRDSLEQIGREEAAFDGDRFQRHARNPPCRLAAGGG